MYIRPQIHHHIPHARAIAIRSSVCLGLLAVLRAVILRPNAVANLWMEALISAQLRLFRVRSFLLSTRISNDAKTNC